MPAYAKHPIFILIETHAAIWIRCNEQWAVTERADDDDVAALVTAAGELERAQPTTMDDFTAKWNVLVQFWRAFEFCIEPDDIEVMLAELAEVTRCTRL